MGQTLRRLGSLIQARRDGEKQYTGRCNMTMNEMAELKERINLYYRLKMEIKILETQISPLNQSLKEIAKGFPMEADGSWKIESNEVLLCVSDTVKVAEEAVNFLERLGRPEMVSSKPYVKKDDLFKVVGKDEAYDLSLIEYITVLRPTLKNKEKLFKDVLSSKPSPWGKQVISMNQYLK